MSTCRDCQYSRMAQQTQGLQLQCRYNPPTIHAVPQGQGSVAYMSMFPAVDQTLWCGRFERDPMQERPQ